MGSARVLRGILHWVVLHFSQHSVILQIRKGSWSPLHFPLRVPTAQLTPMLGLAILAGLCLSGFPMEALFLHCPSRNHQDLVLVTRRDSRTWITLLTLVDPSGDHS